MASMAETQKTSFHARIKRIHKGGPNTMGHILVGSQDSSQGKPMKPIKLRRGPGFFGRLGLAFLDLALMPVSFALGGVAMILGIALIFQLELAGLVETAEEGFWAYSEVCAALVLAIALGGVLRLAKGPRKIALFLGVAAVYFLEPQLRAAYPEPFAFLMPETSPVVAALEKFSSGY